MWLSQRDMNSDVSNMIRTRIDVKVFGNSRNAKSSLNKKNFKHSHKVWLQIIVLRIGKNALTAKIMPKKADLNRTEYAVLDLAAIPKTTFVTFV